MLSDRRTAATRKSIGSKTESVACQLTSLVQVDDVMASVKHDEEVAEIDAEEAPQTTAEQKGQHEQSVTCP